MGSFTGDLLRLLVSQGLHAGSSILGQMISEPMKAARAENQIQQRANIQNLLNTAGTAKAEDLPTIQEQLLQLTKGRVKLPVGPEGNIIRPATDPNHLIAEHFRSNPQAMSDYVSQRTGGLTPALEARLAATERGQDIHEKLGLLTNQLGQDRLATTGQINDLRAQNLLTQADAKIAQVENARLRNEREDRKLNLTEKTQAEKSLETKRAHYENELFKYLSIVKNPDVDPAAREEAANAYSEMVKNVPSEIKPWMKHHTPFQIKKTPKNPMLEKLPLVGGLFKDDKIAITGGQTGSAAPITLEKEQAAPVNPTTGKPYKAGDIYKGKTLIIKDGVLGYER